MSSPIALVGLFVALVLSVLGALSAPGSELAIVAPFGFIAVLAVLAWAVLRADRAADPLLGMKRAIERFEDRWPSFERDFWAHVAAHEATAGLGE
jgi:hypothetical protein